MMCEKGHTGPAQHIDTSVHDDGNIICSAFYYSWGGGIQDNIMERSLHDSYEMVCLSAPENYSKSTHTCLFWGRLQHVGPSSSAHNDYAPYLFPPGHPCHEAGRL